LRPVKHVIRDIETVKKHIDVISGMADAKNNIGRADLQPYINSVGREEMAALSAAWHWFLNGMKSIFIQDANSLIIKPGDLVEILTHLKRNFPFIDRITSYARSHTIARIRDNDLEKIANAGLNRIHIGLESGSDEVLNMVKKGATKEIHIKAGKKVVNAGMELSEYVMPGLGGRLLSETHALETADALNKIAPRFIRLRTFAVRNREELYTSGGFEKCSDVETVEEILLFIEKLNGITSTIKSDHILNLFQEVEGRLPEDKEKMTGILKTFLAMNPEEQMIYQVGRRTGIFSGLSDLNVYDLRSKVEETCRALRITVKNVDKVIDEFMQRFV